MMKNLFNFILRRNSRWSCVIAIFQHTNLQWPLWSQVCLRLLNFWSILFLFVAMDVFILMELRKKKEILLKKKKTRKSNNFHHKQINSNGKYLEQKRSFCSFTRIFRGNKTSIRHLNLTKEIMFILIKWCRFDLPQFRNLAENSSLSFFFVCVNSKYVIIFCWLFSIQKDFDIRPIHQRTSMIYESMACVVAWIVALKSFISWIVTYAVNENNPIYIRFERILKCSCQLQCDIPFHWFCFPSSFERLMI